MPEPRHGGCFKCGSTAFPVLWSVQSDDPKVKSTGIAVCPREPCVPPSEAQRLRELGHEVPVAA